MEMIKQKPDFSIRSAREITETEIYIKRTHTTYPESKSIVIKAEIK